MPGAFPVLAYISLGSGRGRVDLPGRIGEGGWLIRRGRVGCGVRAVCAKAEMVEARPRLIGAGYAIRPHCERMPNGYG